MAFCVGTRLDFAAATRILNALCELRTVCDEHETLTLPTHDQFSLAIGQGSPSGHD